jgi:hypothetical protein
MTLVISRMVNDTLNFHQFFRLLYMAICSNDNRLGPCVHSPQRLTFDVPHVQKMLAHLLISIHVPARILRGREIEVVDKHDERE